MGRCQHSLEVYWPESQNPKSFEDVDLTAARLHQIALQTRYLIRIGKDPRPFRPASGCSCEVPKARGDANPFISKDDVDRFMTVHIECGEAQLAWAKGD